MAHNAANPTRRISCGLRINPEHREVAVALYDPCAPGSRLGVTREALNPELLDGLEGLHFHTLCELDSDALERTLKVVEAKFGEFLHKLKWLNFGGGHHITRPGYDIDRLVRLVRGVRERYNVDVYLEPGEAVAIRTGVLVATVLDIVDNAGPIAILDTSATAHMPDVLEMPYRPEVVGAGKPGEKAYDYRLGGLTCLAGDMIGAYSFDKPLEIGQRIVLLDMSHYTMVKTSNFNGVRLPSIVLRHLDGSYELVKKFGYDSYRDRLS
jgi:carboxynorspermidine decarboxylase